MSDKVKKEKSLYNIFFDICIIGGGASGMAAAVKAMETAQTLKVCIIEKKDEVGKKLLATGNGRCNITNSTCEDFSRVESFLENCNIMLKEEADGRMYPYGEQASAVVELLHRELKEMGVAIFTKCNVLDIKEKDTSQFSINIDCEGEKVSIPCKKILLACGGKASPQFGTSGDGYRIAKSFGHTVSKLRPILMPVECENVKKILKGARAKAKISLFRKDHFIASETGELQFTAEGLSGICIFNLTRYITLGDKIDEDNICTFSDYEIEVDFLPELEEEEVLDMLEERRFRMSRMPAKVFLYSIVNSNIGRAIMEDVLEDKNSSVGSLNYENMEEIVMNLKSCRFQVSGAKGWKDAQCTAGGVVLTEVNMETMESNIYKGLYFAGEILDYDGPCGGYNLNHAWSTGIRAGKAMALELLGKTERENEANV